MTAQGGSLFCFHHRSEPELKLVTRSDLIDGEEEVGPMYQYVINAAVGGLWKLKEEYE